MGSKSRKRKNRGTAPRVGGGAIVPNKKSERVEIGETTKASSDIIVPSGSSSSVPKSDMWDRKDYSVSTFKYSSGPKVPTLRFSHDAWQKLNFICQHAKTEIAGFGVSSVDDLMYVEEFCLLKQEAYTAYVELDDEAMSEFIERMYDQHKKQPVETGRIWIHTHPTGSAEPSGTDWNTFNEKFGGCDWSIMMILSKSEEVSAHLQMTNGTLRGQFPIDVEYEDFSIPKSKSDAWIAEFDATRKKPLAVRAVGTKQPIGFHTGMQSASETAPLKRGRGRHASQHHEELFQPYEWAGAGMGSYGYDPYEDDFYAQEMTPADVMAYEADDAADRDLEMSDDIAWEHLVQGFIEKGGPDMWANNYENASWEGYEAFYEYAREMGEDPDRFDQIGELDAILTCLEAGENMDEMTTPV